MSKPLIFIAIVVAYLAGSSSCKAQTTVQYSNQYGQPIGTATITGGITIYSNQYGQPIGTAISQPLPMPTAPMPLLQTLPSLPVLPLMPMLGDIK